MHLSDTYPQAPSGLFLLNVFKGGKLIETMSEPNLIVVGSKLVQARLLGGDVANRSVTRIGFGSSGVAPAVGNNALTAPYIRALQSVTYPADNQVQFNFLLEAAEANGTLIQEFGLFTAGGALYARKVRSTALAKEADISLQGAWTINF